MKKYFFYVTLSFILLQITRGYSQVQEGSHFKFEKIQKVMSQASMVIPLPNIDASQQKNVKSAILSVKVSSGIVNNYSNIPFDFKVGFSIAPAAFFKKTAYELQVTNLKPEASLVSNLLAYSDVTGNFTANGNIATTINLSQILVNAASSGAGAKIKDSLIITVSYDIEYGLGIKNIYNEYLSAPSALNEVVKGKQATFYWKTPNIKFADFEVQVLRLYNTDSLPTIDETKISAEVDWRRALTMHTESHADSMKITLAEGKGYYIWRVRPIGSFYEGGIANFNNYSNTTWSNFQLPGKVVVSGANDLVNGFFFNDPDDGKNVIYSRTFTEGNQVSEKILYANGLNQLKQTQTYLPSKDTTLVSQSIQDYTGREAVKTMPAPVNGGLEGYRTKIAKKGSAIYSTLHFDEDTNYLHPAPMQGKASEYYSDVNPDPSIPDAEGFSFTRTLYYDDDRVKEQSGVGKAHIIGDSLKGHGWGKTVKTYYGAATETELVRIFGDEAPKAESVSKLVTLDQNNTASVQYISKDGKTIMTSLAVQEADNAGKGKTFDTLAVEGIAFLVSDTLKKNQNTSNGFVNSKRIVLLQPTDLDLSYSISCRNFTSGCSDVTVKCGFSVKVKIHETEGRMKDTILPVYPLNEGNCKDGKVTVNWGKIKLQAGSYVIDKELFSTAPPSLQITASQEAIAKQVNPLAGMLKDWLAEVKCPSKVEVFYLKLKELETDMKTGDTLTLDNKYRTQLKLRQGDHFFTKDHKFSLLFKDVAQKIPVSAILETRCCGKLSILLEFEPKFDCSVVSAADLNSNGAIDTNYDFFNHPEESEVLPDFEGYAIQILKGCAGMESNEQVRDSLYKYMDGWKPGEFNLMVYHMLSDKYSIDGKDYNGNAVENKAVVRVIPAGTVTECGDTLLVDVPITSLACEGGKCTQYTCDQLIACWKAQVFQFRTALCEGLSMDVSGSDPYHPSSKFDEEQGGNQSVHDNTFDEGMPKFFITRWIAKSKISKKMRNLQTGTSDEQFSTPITFQRHLVRDFLKCTGYKFAKIISPTDPEPLPSDKQSGVTYMMPTVNTTSAPVITRGYMPNASWNAYATSDIERKKPLFPNVMDPIYAFKYFEYKEDNQQLQSSVCYDDPNDCYREDPITKVRTKVPCCMVGGDQSFCDKSYDYPNLAKIKDGNDGRDYKLVVKSFCGVGKYICPLTHEYWNSGQRYAFFEMLRNTKAPPASFSDIAPDYSCYQLTETPYASLSPLPDDAEGTGSLTKAQIDMRGITQKCYTRCDERRREFRQYLDSLFAAKCYIVADCKDENDANVILGEDYEVILDSLVGNCRKQCPVTTFSCEERNCRNINTIKTTTGYSITETMIEYGVGGAPGDNCINGRCSGTQLSYCEINKNKQATSWYFEMEIASQCPNPAAPKFTCTDAVINCQPASAGGAMSGGMPDPDAALPMSKSYSNAIKIQVKNK